MSRIIREHYVFGREVVVIASDEIEARIKVGNITTDHIWDICVDSFNAKFWRAYVARHEDCFATDD